jgi:hypothetical protein
MIKDVQDRTVTYPTYAFNSSWVQKQSMRSCLGLSSLEIVLHRTSISFIFWQFCRLALTLAPEGQLTSVFPIPWRGWRWDSIPEIEDGRRSTMVTDVPDDEAGSV